MLRVAKVRDSARALRMRASSARNAASVLAPPAGQPGAPHGLTDGRGLDLLGTAVLPRLRR